MTAQTGPVGLESLSAGWRSHVVMVRYGVVCGDRLSVFLLNRGCGERDVLNNCFREQLKEYGTVQDLTRQPEILAPFTKLRHLQLIVRISRIVPL